MKLFNYFLSIEERFSELRNFIEISEDNYTVYSNNIGLLLLTSCSEFEVVCKEIAIQIQIDRPSRIRQIFSMMSDLSGIVNSDIFDEEIDMSRHKICFKPFDGWTVGDSPFWWKAYNGFKHDRMNKFKEANLKAAIYALGALSIANHYRLWCSNHFGKSRDAPVLSMDHAPDFFKLKKVNYFGPVSDSDIFD